MHTNFIDYTFVSNSRLNYKGGGVGFYIDKVVSFIVRDDLNIMDEKYLNHYSLKLNTKNQQ